MDVRQPKIQNVRALLGLGPGERSAEKEERTSKDVKKDIKVVPMCRNLPHDKSDDR